MPNFDCAHSLFVFRIPDERRSIIAEFKGHVNKLLRSSAPAASVIEYAYNNYANAQERDMYVRENYGNHFLMHEVRNICCLLTLTSYIQF